jgi:hypothetical protein
MDYARKLIEYEKTYEPSFSEDSVNVLMCSETVTTIKNDY